MGRIYEMAIALSGKVDGSLNASLLSTSGSLAGLENKLNTLNTAQQKLGRYKELKNNIVDTNIQYKLAQSEAGRLAREIAGVEKPSKSMQRGFDQATGKAEKLRGKLMVQGQELRVLRGEMDRAGVSTQKLGKIESELADKAERASRAQSQLQRAVAARNAAGDRLKWSNMQAEVISSAGIALALRKPIKDAAELEMTMAGIKKVVDFDSPEVFKQMGADLQRLSLKIPMTSKALGEIYASGGQAGIAQKDLLDFTVTAPKMGIAFNVEAEQAGEWMAKWRTAFQMNQAEVTVLADQINYLGNNTAATASEISAVVSKIGPLGKIGNVAAKQIAALAASIVGAGQSEDVAATGTKNFMLALTAGSAATKKQQEAFAKLRIDPKIMAKEMIKDPEKVMIGVLERISKVEKSSQSALVTEIFGKQAVAAIAPLLSNLDNLKQNLAMINGNDSVGSMEKEFAAIADTATNSMQLAANAAKVTSQNLGKSLLPAVKTISKAIVGMSGKLADLSEKYPVFSKVLVTSIAALGAIKVVSTGLSLLKTMITFPYLQVKTGILGIKAAWVAADGSLVTMIRNTKLAKAATAVWTGVQWLWVKAMAAGRAVLNAGRIVVYKAASLAAAAVTKAWTGIQWLWAKAMIAGKTVLSAGRIVVYKIVSLAAAGATSIWTGAQWLWVTAMSAGKAVLSVAHIAAYKAASVAVSVVTKLWTAAQWLLNAALTANPIGLIVATVGALVAAFVVAYKKMDWFRNGIDGAMASVKAVFVSSFEKVASMIDKVSEKWNKLMAFLHVSPKIPEPQTKAVSVGITPHAAGGHFDRPHLGLVAEAGVTESIVPHNGRGEKIWQEAGRMAGFSVDPQNPEGGLTINLTVNASGGADGNELGRQIVRVLKAELPRALRSHKEQGDRVAFA